MVGARGWSALLLSIALGGAEFHRFLRRQFFTPHVRFDTRSGWSRRRLHRQRRGAGAATSSGLKRVKAEQLTKFEKFLADHGMIAPFASGVALVCIGLALATLTSWLRVNLKDSVIAAAKAQEPALLQQYLFQHLNLTIHVAGPVRWIGILDHCKLDALATFVVFAAACLVAFFANKFVNINTFSLHGMYRMRLTRAYLRRFELRSPS